MSIYKIIKIILYIVLLPINLIHHFLGYKVVKINYRRIGHLVSEYDYILTTYAVDNKYIYFAIQKNECANKYLIELISRSHRLITNKALVLLIESMTRWGRYSVVDTSQVILANHGPALYSKILNESNPSIYKNQIKNELNSERSKLLTKIFGSVPDWYVCIHVRTDDDKYKDGEIQEYRNSKVKSFKKAVDYINNKGGLVILMGSKNRVEKINFNNFFDYASSNYKSDINDIILISGCKFFLGSTSGLFQVATFFNIPCGLSNVVPLSVSPFSKNDFYIYKHHYDNFTNRFLNFDEVKSIGLESERSKWHLQNRITLVENTEEEIENLCKIMFDQVILGKEVPKTVYGYAKLNPAYYGFYSMSKLDPTFDL